MDWLRWILLLIGAAIVVAIWWTGYRRTRERDETLFERARRDPGDDLPPRDDAGDADEPPRDGSGNAPDLDVSAFSPLPADDTPDLEVDVDAPARPPDEPEHGAGPAPERPAAGAADEAPAVAGRPAPPRGGERGAGAPESGEERVESLFLVATGGERLVGSRLQALFARHGLRHGEMGIFHLHDAEGHVQFSVANLVEPGTFDPATMDTLSTPGIALFLRLPGPPSAEVAFDRMIRIARSMADELEARLLDARQSTLTRQTEQHLREAMREYDHRNPRSRA